MESSRSARTTTRALAGAQLLVVEDDFLLLMDLEEVLLDAGAHVRACRTIADALLLSEKEEVSAAILDVRIGAESIAPVARELAARAIPFIFYTGQLGNDPMMAEWANSKTLSKPALPQVIVNTVAELLRAQIPPAQVLPAHR